MHLRSTVAAYLFVLLAIPAAAQQATAESDGGPDADDPIEQVAAPDAAQIEELRRRIDVLAAELEQLRSGETPQAELTDERRRSLGLAPSAAATYRRASEGVSFAGYGEMLLENFRTEGEARAVGPPTTRLDFLRAVLYAGYRFNDKFLFNSEIEIEHSNEISVEFAYIDYLANDHLTLRGGMILLPLGLVNEFHEPTVFIGAKRPETEQRILPTTWRENGAGVLGSLGMVNFRAYVTNGLRATGFTAAGFRGGRQKGAQALAANLAFSGRVDVTPIPGLFAGVGVYTGGSGQEQVRLNQERFDVQTTIVEVHGQAQMRGLDLRALFAQGSIDHGSELNRIFTPLGGGAFAKTMQGGYIQVGYNVLSQVDTALGLTPYVRYEQVDTQHRVPTSVARDLAFDGMFKTVGVELKPIPNVVIKTDYQWITNRARTGRNQFNLNLGYAF